MSKMSDLQMEIENYFNSGLTAADTARRLGVSLNLVSKAYRDLQDEVYMDQEDRSYVSSYVSRYSNRAEAGLEWD